MVISFPAGFHRYLKHHKLHKYLYFFCNLSYLEIASIDASNIHHFENKVNIFPMTTGARNAILRKITELNSRHLRLQALSEVTIPSSDFKFSCVRYSDVKLISVGAVINLKEFFFFLRIYWSCRTPN